MNQPLPRHVQPRVETLLGTFRAVVINGPRAGKTTMARELIGRLGGTFLSLDDESTLQAALDDPRGLLNGLPRPVAIDEVQRGGDALVRAVKWCADQDTSPGQFLLLGSARFLTVPTLTESLAGRAVVTELWPLTQGEIEGVRETFIDRVFDAPETLCELRPRVCSRADLVTRAVRGGFPEVLQVPDDLRRTWFDAYLASVVSRDIAAFSDARKLHVLPKVVRLIAARTSQLLVKADLARDAALNQVTFDEYLGYLETVMLTRTLPAWHRNLTSRAGKTPKIVVSDSGIAAALTVTGSMVGPLVETFVANELDRARGWADNPVELFHLRDRDAREVDLVLEHRDGRVVAMEIKSSTTVRSDDFANLHWLDDRLGGNLVAGIVLYAGDQVLSFGERFVALPVSSLWATASAS